MMGFIYIVMELIFNDEFTFLIIKTDFI
jgi:hypothetical protein